VQPVVTSAEMRALDRATSEEVGIAGFTLMETAGRAVADAAIEMLGNRRGPVAVVCGPGNNGGDGFVVARVLRAHGIDATAYLAARRDAIAGDARAHLEVLERSGGVVIPIDTPAELAQREVEIARAALAVDALFGIGAGRPIQGHLAAVIAAINAAPLRLAVDVPSGIEADTGRVLGVGPAGAPLAVDAHRTVTMGPLKIALAGAPGFARAGQVTLADIGIPPPLIAASSVRAGLVERADIAKAVPRSGPLDHKGTRGHVVVVGGRPEMRGAGRLAAIAALRAGAGLVTLAGSGEVAAADPVMTRSLGERAELADLLVGKAAVVIGPGLGTRDPARGQLAEVLASGVPAVLDADALNTLAASASVARLGATSAGPVVITPHPGEAARLLEMETAAVEADRLAAARALAAKTHAVVVLKGARTVICDGTLGDEFCAINPTGGPALATGGSGDVLAGVIGALIAQGLPPAEAARVAVYVHGLAGERLATVHGTRGVIASDLPDAIAQALDELARTSG
jgi:ADP-dependent NAD(P)H-hydrate dehydratase / NAD(P)H-hydrate epimerase